MMKKLFLFVAALTLSLTSCSSDDDKGGNSELKVTIDGVQKTFNTIVVNEIYYEEDGGWTDLTVTVTINNDPSEMITFSLEEGSLGASAVWSFNYTKDGKSYNSNSQGATFSSVVQTNSNKKLKGTFTGKLIYSYYDYENSEEIIEEVNLTNGSFDISY